MCVCVCVYIYIYIYIYICIYIYISQIYICCLYNKCKYVNLCCYICTRRKFTYGILPVINLCLPQLRMTCNRCKQPKIAYVKNIFCVSDGKNLLV